jgi:hypothetical protein
MSQIRKYNDNDIHAEKWKWWIIKREHLQVQSLTYCENAKLAATLAGRSVLYKTNHLHAVTKQRWQQHQQGGLDFERLITYMLWEGKGGNNSARRSGLCKTYHLQPVGRQRWQQHQQDGLYFARPITYVL